MKHKAYKERQELLRFIIVLKIKLGNELLFNLPIDKRDYAELLTGLNELREFVRTLPVDYFGNEHFINNHEPDVIFVKKKTVKIGRGGISRIEAMLKDHGLTYENIDENFKLIE